MPDDPPHLSDASAAAPDANASVGPPSPRAAGRWSGSRRLRIGVVVLVWSAVLIAWFTYRHRSGLGPVDAAQSLVESARGSWWAVFAFVLASAIRPFLLVPAVILTVAIGIVFGPFLGLAVALVGVGAAAVVGYAIGGALAPGVLGDGRIALWTVRMRDRSFETILVLRLLFLPYDLVNYAAGYLRVRWWPFLAATAIGVLPGTVAFVLLGASITDLGQGFSGIDPLTLVLSIALIVGGLVVAQLVRRRVGVTR